jgi:hypothetical protein
MAVELTPSLTWSANGQKEKGSEPAQGHGFADTEPRLMVCFLAGSVKP